MQEREAINSAIADDQRMIPQQLWYDSLRETDDGRFSSSLLRSSMSDHDKFAT
jgi:hypothetical protein